jgi:hypothetical protein
VDVLSSSTLTLNLLAQQQSKKTLDASFCFSEYCTIKYQIGMTRRLEPMDRIKELGAASVPFNFDVHAMPYNPFRYLSRKR